MCIHHPESLRGNQTQTFPLFLGYDLNKPSLLSSTGMVEVRLWAIPGFSPTRGFWEIYCKDKVTDDQGFSEQQTEAITEKCIWNHMDIYIYIEKHSSQRNLLQVVVAWRNYTPSEADSYCLLWKTSQKAIGLPISFWVAGQNLATVAIVVICSPLITPRDALTVPSALSIPSIHGVIIFREMY